MHRCMFDAFYYSLIQYSDGAVWGWTFQESEQKSPNLILQRTAGIRLKDSIKHNEVQHLEVKTIQRPTSTKQRAQHQHGSRGSDGSNPFVGMVRVLVLEMFSAGKAK